jgi:hypothetical protein
MLADGAVQLSPAARQRITVGYRMIDATDAEAQALKKDLQRFGTHQPACRALVDAQYGIGGLIAVAVWSELGDCRRFSRSEQAVRHTGLDVSVDSSARRRAGRDGRDRPSKHQGHPRSAPATGVPASTRAGRPSNTDATALPAHGGHPITIVVADDQRFVEHLGNAGRPHAAADRRSSHR